MTADGAPSRANRRRFCSFRRIRGRSLRRDGTPAGGPAAPRAERIGRAPPAEETARAGSNVLANHAAGKAPMQLSASGCNGGRQFPHSAKQLRCRGVPGDESGRTELRPPL